PGGSQLTFSTYLGGANNDIARGIAVNSAGDMYVIGETGSTDFPTANPIQAANAVGVGVGQASDVFVTKFSGAGPVMEFSTYLGGPITDTGRAIALDSADN